ncbi:hypothetical protein ES703_123418 [subsurface metagenome]
MCSENNDWSKTLSSLSKPIKEVTEFLSLIIKPSAKEAGELLAGEFKYWRIKRGLSILQKTKKLLEDNGINPKKVSLKFFIPLLESSSLEEEEFMQNKWARLLANAVNQDYEEEIRPCYVEILKELTSTEVRLLDKMFEELNRRLPEEEYEELLGIDSVCKFLDLSRDKYFIMSDNLIRLNLCQPTPIRGMSFSAGPLKNQAAMIRTKKVSYLTLLGYSFVKACKFEGSKDLI